MSTEKPIAGADIKPGMTVILKPGGPLVPVARVEPAQTTDSWVYLYARSEAGHVDGNLEIVWLNRWYVEVTS